MQELPAAYKDAEIVDFGNQLVMPGFVDAHVHPCQLPNIGLGYDMELFAVAGHVYVYTRAALF